MIDFTNNVVHRTSNINKDTDGEDLHLPQALKNIRGVCGAGEALYFFRNDGTLFTRFFNIDGHDIPVSIALHPACQDGDYYFATDYESFYVIYGTHVHHSSDLSTNSDPSDFALHPKLVEFMPFTDFSADWVSIFEGETKHFTTPIKCGVNETLSDSFTATGPDAS